MYIRFRITIKAYWHRWPPVAQCAMALRPAAGTYEVMKVAKILPLLSLEPCGTNCIDQSQGVGTTTVHAAHYNKVRGCSSIVEYVSLLL